MSETSQFDDEFRRELVQRHDGLLNLSMLNRKERRRRGVRVQKRDIERMLFATGMVIAQAGEPEKPVYASAKEFLDANPE